MNETKSYLCGFFFFLIILFRFLASCFVLLDDEIGKPVSNASQFT